MARRRPPAAPVVDVGGVPPELAERCWIEEWLSAAELAEKPNVPAAQGVSHEDWALVVAANRWRDARRAWLDGHGVLRETECAVIPFRGPRWRSQTVPAP